MKNLKKLMFSLAALVLAFGLVFSVSAFKANTQKVTTLKYRFIGSNESDLNDPLKWQNVSGQTDPETCATGNELPCLVIFQDNEYDNVADFYDTHPSAASMFLSAKVVSKKD